MDEQYKSLYKQAANMQFKMHDYTLQSAHDPQTMLIRTEMHNLTNDIATGRSPLTVEARLKTIENQLRRAEMTNPSTAVAGQSPIMHYDHSSFLRKNLEGMRTNLRQHPNY